MKPLTFNFIVGVVAGILVAYFSEESLRGFLESNFFQTLALLFIGTFLVVLFRQQHELQKKLDRPHLNLSLIAIAEGQHATIINTGKEHLYLCGYRLPGIVITVPKPKLLAATSMIEAGYPLPAFLNQSISTNVEFEFTLFLKDHHGKKFVSEHGGVFSQQPFQHGMHVLKTWSYGVKKHDWTNEL